MKSVLFRARRQMRTVLRARQAGPGGHAVPRKERAA